MRRKANKKCAVVTGELPIAGSLNFHELGLIISGACTILAIVISAYSIWMHALNYTKPREQRQCVYPSTPLRDGETAD